MVRSSDFTPNAMEATGNVKQGTFTELRFRVTLVTVIGHRRQVCRGKSHQEAVTVAQGAMTG